MVCTYYIPYIMYDLKNGLYNVILEQGVNRRKNGCYKIKIGGLPALNYSRSQGRIKAKLAICKVRRTGLNQYEEKQNKLLFVVY